MTDDDLLGVLAELGPFFAIDTHDRGASPAGEWHAFGDLVVRGDPVARRVSAVRDQLAAMGGQRSADVELRVAASVTHLGMVARIVSPVLAAATVADTVLDVRPRGVWWQPELGGAFPLSIPNDQISGGSAAMAPIDDEIARRVVDGPVRLLVNAMEPFSVPHKTLWGNVASAFNGAATMIAATRPADAGKARDIAARLRRSEPLLGTGTVGAQGFRRTSCCLIYRAAPDRRGPVCGDCVLVRD